MNNRRDRQIVYLKSNTKMKSFVNRNKSYGLRMTRIRIIWGFKDLFFDFDN